MKTPEPLFPPPGQPDYVYRELQRTPPPPPREQWKARDVVKMAEAEAEDVEEL